MQVIKFWSGRKDEWGDIQSRPAVFATWWKLCKKMSFSIFNNIAHLFCQFMAQENYAGLGATRDANKFNPSNQENEHGHASASIAAAFAHISVIVIDFLLKCRQNGECACSAPLPKQGACFYLEREKRRCAYSGLGVHH